MENEVSRTDSSWKNSKICSENSEWVAENVKCLDQSVKEMLQLIEQDGGISTENPPIQPELIACVKEISHRHHLLVNHYNNVTGELRDYEKTSLGPQSTYPFLTPERKHGMPNVEGLGVPAELSSGGGISDMTPIEGSESSILSSDSDSESYNSSPEKMLKHEIANVQPEISEMVGGIALDEQYETMKGKESGKYEMMMRRILDHEKEFEATKEKLKLAEEEIDRLKFQLESNAANTVELANVEAQLVLARNHINMHEDELEEESKRSLMLQRQIVDLEGKLEIEKQKVHELEESVKKYAGELLDRDCEIEKLNADLLGASANLDQEKQRFESSVLMLSENLSFHEARANELQKQCESFEAEKVEMVRKQEVLEASWQNNIEYVKAELHEKIEIVDTLKEDLDNLRLHYEMAVLEKDYAKDYTKTLKDDLSVCKDQILCMDMDMNELHAENERLSSRCHGAQKAIAELQSDIKNYKAEISYIAEGKKEAIRQLCFSLDHFRSAYEELHESTYSISKRRAATAS